MQICFSNTAISSILHGISSVSYRNNRVYRLTDFPRILRLLNQLEREGAFAYSDLPMFFAIMSKILSSMPNPMSLLRTHTTNEFIGSVSVLLTLYCTKGLDNCIGPSELFMVSLRANGEALGTSEEFSCGYRRFKQGYMWLSELIREDARVAMSEVNFYVEALIEATREVTLRANPTGKVLLRMVDKLGDYVGGQVHGGEAFKEWDQENAVVIVQPSYKSSQ